MGKICRHCGASMGDNDRFCENCGAKYEEVVDNALNNSINEPITYGNNAQQSVTVNSNYEIDNYSVGKTVILSIVTLGIYAIYWGYKLTKDINELCKDKMKPLPNYFLAIFLSIITLGLYGAYWSYQVAKRLYEISPVYGVEVKEKPQYMLLVAELGGFTVGATAALWLFYICKNMNTLRIPYNDGFRNLNAEIKQNYSTTGNKVQLVISIILAIMLIVINVYNFTGGKASINSENMTADSGKYLLNSQILIDNDGFQGYLDEELDRIDSDFQKSECCKMNPGYNLRYENVTSADLLSDRRNFDVYISNRANENINASDSPQFSYFLFDADGDSLIDTIMIAFYSYGTMGNGWSDFLWDEITETVKRNLTVLTDLSAEKRKQVYATLWGDQEQGGDPQWARTKESTVCKVGNFHIRAAFVSSAESNFIFTSIQDEDWLNNLFSDCNIIDLSSNDTL